MRYLLRVFLLSALLSHLSAFAEEPVRIGAILHLTGDLASTSAAFREGIELARDELNARESAPHYEVSFEDGRNAANHSVAAGHKLLAGSKLSAVILESYLDVMASGSLFEKAKIPAVCLWDSNPDIDKAGHYIFAIGPWTPSAGEEAARFAAEELRGKTAVVFFNSDSWSEGVKGFFEAAFEKRGGKVLDSYRLNPQDTDFRTIIAKTAALNPDVIYTPLVFNLVPFYSQLRALRFQKPIISSDIIADEHISKAPQAFEGIYQTGIRDPSSPEYESLAIKYEKHFGKKVTLPWFVAAGYDGLHLIDTAVRNSGKSPELITKGLYAIKDYKGASSVLSINEHGTAPQFESMFRVIRGRLEHLKSAGD